MNIECSSAGDKRFSAFYAHIYQENKSVEEAYQTSKVILTEDYEIIIPGTWQEGKRRKPICHHYNGRLFPLSDGPKIFAYLWYEYLCENLELVPLIEAKDTTFTDRFDKGTFNNTPQVMRQINTKGWKMFSIEMTQFRKYLSHGGEKA